MKLPIIKAKNATELVDTLLLTVTNLKKKKTPARFNSTRSHSSNLMCSKDYNLKGL